MHLVDDVDLVPPFPSRIGHAFAQIAHILHARVRGRVNLDNVERPSLLRGHAGRALGARISIVWVEAVHCLGQNAGCARLSRPSWPGEQIRVRRAPLPDRVAQGADHVLLPVEIVERARPPLAVQSRHGHPLPVSGHTHNLDPRRYYTGVPAAAGRPIGARNPTRSSTVRTTGAAISVARSAPWRRISSTMNGSRSNSRYRSCSGRRLSITRSATSSFTVR